jgi:hypothetical protein
VGEAGAPDIEVTQQMILAGKAALERHFPNSSEEQLVVEVFRAMEAAKTPLRY